MKHITPLRDDEPTDAEEAGKLETPLHAQQFGRVKRPVTKRKSQVIDDAMRSPTPAQIRSAH